MTQIPPELYAQIVRWMPIPCVDLLVTDRDGQILLVRRRNEPARGQWWFPGGRILFGERRSDAAMRKLAEETSLRATTAKEIGTYDVLLDTESGERMHAITTLFEMHVNSSHQVELDEQSDGARWLSAREWLATDLHPFVRQRFTER